MIAAEKRRVVGGSEIDPLGELREAGGREFVPAAGHVGFLEVGRELIRETRLRIARHNGRPALAALEEFDAGRDIQPALGFLPAVATEAVRLEHRADVRLEQVTALRHPHSVWRDSLERLRGSNLAWFGLDELTYTSQEAWLRLEGRLRDPKATRLCGFAVWTPKGYDWVYERFVASPVSGYEMVMAQPFENRFLLDRIPDYYERLKQSYDARFYEQEVLGQYLDMHAGRVYFAFDRKENVVERPVLSNCYRKKSIVA